MLIDTPILIGAGGHGRVVLDAWLLVLGGQAIEVRDDSGRVATQLGFPVHTPALPENVVGRSAHVAIGDSRIRKRISLECAARGGELASVVHPAACVSRHAVIGAGCYIAAQAVVGPGAVLGMGVIINHGAVVDHDCEIGSWAHIAPGSILGGSVRIGSGVLIGSGSVILPGCLVSDGATVGSGAVVTRNIGPGECWMGVPARRKNG